MIKFGEPKNINVGGMEIIPIRTGDNKSLRVTTGKCFSFGVKKDQTFKTTSMSLKLDDATTTSLQNILDQCEAQTHRYRKKYFSKTTQFTQSLKRTLNYTKVKTKSTFPSTRIGVAM